MRWQRPAGDELQRKRCWDPQDPDVAVSRICGCQKLGPLDNPSVWYESAVDARNQAPNDMKGNWTMNNGYVFYFFLSLLSLFGFSFQYFFETTWHILVLVAVPTGLIDKDAHEMEHKDIPFWQQKLMANKFKVQQILIFQFATPLCSSSSWYFHNMPWPRRAPNTIQKQYTFHFRTVWACWCFLVKNKWRFPAFKFCFRQSSLPELNYPLSFASTWMSCQIWESFPASPIQDWFRQW